MSYPDFNKPTGHGVCFSGNFEIKGKISSDLGRKAGYRSYVVYLNCGGADCKEETRYKIRAVVKTETDQFYFEASDQGLIGPADEFKGQTIGTVGVTGLGFVAKISTIVEECYQYLKDKDDSEDPKTTVVTVKHTNYHPAIKPAPTFHLEYRVRPFKYLSGIPRILKLGREAMFHGYIKDFNEETCCYIVIANRFSTTCGHHDTSKFKTKVGKEETVTEGGRTKPKKFPPKSFSAPFKSPIIVPPPTTTLCSGPAEHPTAPLLESSTESGKPLATEPVTQKRPATAAPKKRLQAQVARRTSSTTTLDLTTQEETV